MPEFFDDTALDQARVNDKEAQAVLKLLASLPDSTELVSMLGLDGAAIRLNKSKYNRNRRA